MKKTFTIVHYHRGRETEVKGTIEELTKYFSYTLECGHSWNYKINQHPRTISSLVNNLNDSYHEKMRACYDQDYVYLKQ